MTINPHPSKLPQRRHRQASARAWIAFRVPPVQGLRLSVGRRSGKPHIIACRCLPSSAISWPRTCDISCHRQESHFVAIRNHRRHNLPPSPSPVIAIAAALSFGAMSSSTVNSCTLQYLNLESKQCRMFIQSEHGCQIFLVCSLAHFHLFICVAAHVYRCSCFNQFDLLIICLIRS